MLNNPIISDYSLAMITKIYSDSEFSANALQEAEAGDNSAQLQIACAYINGNSVSQDEILGMEWLTRAADNNNPLAQHFLYSAYLSGHLVSKDVPTAIKYLTRATELNFIPAQSALAFLHTEAPEFIMPFIEHSIEKSHYYAMKSAMEGCSNAQFLIGKMMFESQGPYENNANSFLEGQRIIRAVGCLDIADKPIPKDFGNEGVSKGYRSIPMAGPAWHYMLDKDNFFMVHLMITFPAFDIFEHSKITLVEAFGPRALQGYTSCMFQS